MPLLSPVEELVVKGLGGQGLQWWGSEALYGVIGGGSGRVFCGDGNGGVQFRSLVGSGGATTRTEFS